MRAIPVYERGGYVYSEWELGSKNGDPFLLPFPAVEPGRSVHATGPTGTITGTVSDPSGAFVPKAQITVRSMETNATREALIRGEFFNVTNHPNLDIPNHTLGSPTFSQVLSANAHGNKPPRQIQLGAKYSF